MTYRSAVMLLCLLVCLFSVAVAQSVPDLWMTGDKLNGHAWQALSEKERVMYLRGVREAMLTVRPQEYGNWLPRGSYEEIASAIDKIYSNPLKIDIPMLNALRMVRDQQATQRLK